MIPEDTVRPGPQAGVGSGDVAPSTVTPRPGSRADKVDAVATAVRAVPGVADLHGGVLGEIGTYLPGRRVLGLRLRPDTTEVHVSLLYGAPLRETASAVRAAVAGVVPGPVDVTVEDVVTAAELREQDGTPEALPPSPAPQA